MFDFGWPLLFLVFDWQPLIKPEAAHGEAISIQAAKAEPFPKKNLAQGLGPCLLEHITEKFDLISIAARTQSTSELDRVPGPLVLSRGTR